MHLKRIEIAGFKSFADRTVIEFDQGLTAVVGPNGSGKSNITEAIRWVLGEQSAKNLRGGKMPDIIFAGAESRKPLNRAEVTVVLDNEERFLPLDFNEVSVTRRLNRSGDSDFYINKQSCRLKDVVDLFMDSGLGKESFSIISQGKVEAIFNSKPEDRRGIFEEAAGVLKYKQRKRKAEQKLFETEDNLNRVEDIIYELEAQLEPLREQREVAQRYVTLKSEHTRLDVSISATEITRLQAEWQAQHEELAEATVALEKVRRHVGAVEDDLDHLREERDVLDASIEKQQTALLEATESFQRIEGERKVLAERSKHTNASRTSLAATLTEYEEKIVEQQALLQERKNELAGKKAVQDTLTQAIEAKEVELKRYSKSAKERLAELRNEYVDAMQAQANERNEYKHLERRYQQESSKNEQTIRRFEQLQQALTEKKTAQNDLAEKVAAQDASLAAALSQYQTQQQALQEQKALVGLKEKQYYEVQGLYHQAQAKQKSLEDLQENYRNFYQGVRAVLQTKERLTGIVGAVAELVQVPKELALATETALGAAAQHVIVENEAAARAAIHYLKEQRLGRATFLPLTTIKPRAISATTRQQISQMTGYLGVAAELVMASEKVQPIIQNLLGMTIFAADLTSANQLAKAVRYQYRVVSLEGDVMNAGGSMTGGATRKGNQGTLFTQAQELQEVTEKVKQMQSALKEREAQLSALRQRYEASEADLESLRSAGEQARFTQQEWKNQYEVVTAEIRQIEREQKAFEFESQDVQAFLAEYAERKPQLEAQLAYLAERLVQLDKEMGQVDEEEESNQQMYQRVQEEVQELQTQSAVALEQVHQLRQQVLATEQTVTETQSALQAITFELEAVAQSGTDHVTTAESLDERLRALGEEKARLQTALHKLRQARETCHHRIQELDGNLAEENRVYQRQLDEKNKIELIGNRLELQLDRLLKHLQEDYQLTYEAAQSQGILIEDLATAQARCQTLKQEIDALGPVNLNAIEQFEQIHERYQFLVTQRDDLLSAKNSLFETMGEMDEVVKTKFSEVFDAISLQFQNVFPSMFGGGHAELKLTDPLDLLNTGIEIVAQPPGKKLQSLSLLSGGERALTAIALLFSIIKVRPVPFCILDEVEAALDEANVARFGHYLAKFENNTQFIVITHRKGTMEAADVLYGVTMQESGVSTIVSVRLEEVDAGGNFELANEKESLR